MRNKFERVRAMATETCYYVLVTAALYGGVFNRSLSQQEGLTRVLLQHADTFSVVTSGRFLNFSFCTFHRLLPGPEAPYGSE